MKNILIIGATSAIATEVAREFAKENVNFYLLARNQERLDRLANDLVVRGASAAHTDTFDANDLGSHEHLLERALKTLGSIDAVLIAHGDLPDQSACQRSFQDAQRALNTSLLSQISFLTWLANYFENKRSGNITVISSVAGDRGRQSNYVYGAAKGGLSTFLQGLRNRLAFAGVSVTTIKPGFVDTPMTQHLPKGPLFADPANVGHRIHKAMLRGESVVYTPWFWRYIMLIILHIPEFIFKKLKL
ncbi:MAG: SDR family oxidoreductase [Pseudomonadota bacterium]|jgi:short-subunit dehydrogenase